MKSLQRSTIDISLTILCLALGAWLVAATVRWPFMGDATYLHYVVFLIKHGRVPYRDIAEINMPLAYVFEQATMFVFGSGALGWRLFDFFLIGTIVASCCSILKSSGIAPGLLAGTLFAAIHAQDGVMMSGERDLVVAVCQVASLALLIQLSPRSAKDGSSRRWIAGRAILAGGLTGISVCIKPTAVLFLPLVLGYGLVQCATIARERYRVAGWMTAGAMLPGIVSMLYLLRKGSLLAFWDTLRGLIAYHAQLEKKPILFLVNHSFAPIAVLLPLYLAVLYLDRRAPRIERHLLLAVWAVAGWSSYLFQGKGFAYQRYPFLLFLVILLVSSFYSVLGKPALLGWVGRIALLVCVSMTGFFVHRAAGYSHADPFSALSSDLSGLGGASLSGEVQCMDTAGGCIASLYQERIVQATGFIYDCYFEDADHPVVQSLRSRFESQFRAAQPKWVVLTDSVCFGKPRSFYKLQDWPFWANEMADHYHLYRERSFTSQVRYWNRAEVPYSYRIYERNSTP